jgi:glucose-1-phosphate cytidylyltransferase
MKVIILAGGLGSRLGSVGEVIPKPMVEVGGRPMLWHIMKIFSHYGLEDFIICLGHKGNLIKDYFHNFSVRNSDFTIDLSNDKVSFHGSFQENWRVTLVETGIETLKGGRIKRVEPYLDTDINILTYGDGMSDIDIASLLDFHKSHDRPVTITGVRPPSLFGEMVEDGGKVASFEEKPQTSKGLINGGFIVFEREMMKYLNTDKNCDFEFGPLEQMVKENKVMVYKHRGFWECADTVRDIAHLNMLWESDQASWRVWS